MTDDSAAAGSEIFAPGFLDGQVAIVTGGGTGLGLATALELARCGARVTITGRRREVLDEAIAANAWATELLDGAVSDVREVEECRGLMTSVLERHGRFDMLVNNAGGQFFSPAELISANGWRAVWRLNVDGMLNMSEAAVDLAFAPVGGGRIVNVTLAPHHGMPGMAHSGAARATVEALTRELSNRWAHDGVSVSAIAVGVFETDALQKYPDPVKAGMSRTVPLGRLGTAREHAWLATLLASPLGNPLSGSTITIDGARDNWWGSWPPPGLTDDAGNVPVEERKAAGAAPA